MSKEKHLEFIQGVINRHNSNSFMLKGWSVTLSAAIYAVAGTVQDSSIIIIAFVPIILFWGLDAFYLSNERCFVDLYRSVASGSFSLPIKKMYKKDFSPNNTNANDINNGVVSEFEMHFKLFEIWKDNSWLFVLKSKTIFWFYMPMVGLTVALLIVFSNFENNKHNSIDVNATIQPNDIEFIIKSEPPTIINNISSCDSIKNKTQSQTNSSKIK